MYEYIFYTKSYSIKNDVLYLFTTSVDFFIIFNSKAIFHININVTLVYK